MSDDFLKRLNQAGQNWFGEDRGPDDVKRDWHIYGHSKRAEALDTLDDHLRGMTDVAPAGEELRNFSRLTRLRRELGDMHQALIKANR